jgi:FixJ family two-component response regulator
MVMAQLLLIDDDPGTLEGFGLILRAAGHAVLSAPCGTQGLSVLLRESVDLVLTDLRLPDMSGLEILRHARAQHRPVPCVIITGFGSARDAVTAMRLGAVDFLEKPVFEDGLLHAVRRSLGAAAPEAREAEPIDDDGMDDREAHAAARWARVLVPIIDSPKDPRTISGWCRLAFVSPGALRNWCRMAGVSPRRSLVFARLLRAVLLGHGGRHKPENLLDIVDRRTLVGLLRLAGLNPQHDFPQDVDTFLQQQALIRDPDALFEIRRALAARRPLTSRLPPVNQR